MAYLLTQIWLLLVLAAGLGWILGWAVRTLGARDQARTLTAEIERGQALARRQQEDAARLSAKLQMRSDATTQAQVVELTKAVHAAREDAGREAAEAGALRTLVNDLQKQIAQTNDPSANSAQSEDAAALQAQIAQLQADLAAATAAAPVAANAEADDDVAALRSRIAELEPLEQEVARLASQLASTDVAPGDQLAKAKARLHALEQGDQDGYAASGGQAPYWLAARNRWLELQVTDLQAAAVGRDRAEPDSDTAEREKDVLALKAEISHLRRELEQAARPPLNDPETPPAPLASDIQDMTRLQWRVQYLTSRVRVLEARLTQDGAEDIDAAAPGTDEDPSLDVQLQTARKEIAELQGRLAQAQIANAQQSDHMEAEHNRENATAWRMRYLISRVAYLEQRLAEPADPQSDDAELHAEMEALRAKVEGMRAQVEEAGRLRVRIAQMEADDIAARSGADEDRAVEWRNRYLSSRVKYLEEQVQSLRDDQRPV